MTFLSHDLSLNYFTKFITGSSCARVCCYGFFLGIYFASFCCIVLTGCPKYFKPLTVLIPNYKYRCDIIHPLVRYHGRSRRSPAPPSRPLGGPSGSLGGPSGPLGGPSGPLGGPSRPLGESSGPLGGPSGRPNTQAACDTQPSNIWAYMPFGGAHTFEAEGGQMS